MSEKLQRPIAIKSTIPVCGCREAFCPHTYFGTHTEDELRALKRLVKLFSREMLAKLERKQREGYADWDSADLRVTMWESLKRHVDRGPSQALDIANLAMFVWNLEDQDD